MLTGTLSFDIHSISTAIPSRSTDLNSFSEIFGTTDIKKIINTTGISSIRVVDENTTASDLCFAAAEHLINKTKISRSEIDALIFVSQTPDYKLPQTSHILQQRLGLGTNTFCLDIPLGCSGYIHGLFQAGLLLNSGCCANVLVLAGDTTSKMINKLDRSLRMVFGDAGSATLVKASKFKSVFSINSDGAGANQLIIPAGGARCPITKETSITQIAEDQNIRSEEDLFMDGMGIFNFAMSKVPHMFEELIAKANWNKEDIGTVAFHQANKFMVEYLRKRMKLTSAQAPIEVDGYGNTGPATIPLLLSNQGNILKEMEKLDKVVLLGFGVGLSWAGVTCNLNNTIFLKPIEHDSND
jgi:3-oxoacyl-[acyl-carrier-protein] synthase-3